MNCTSHTRSRVLAAFVFAFLMGVAACTSDPGTGPSEIHWDQDSCQRCAMAISDRRFAAEVRAAPGEPVRKFDDIGCALLWTHGLAGNQRETAQVWVTDHDTGAWLDGRSARYRAGANSPMNYGFSAHAAGDLSFDEVIQALADKENSRRSGP